MQNRNGNMEIGLKSKDFTQYIHFWDQQSWAVGSEENYAIR